MSSNIAQNYPYGSESEADRAEAVAKAIVQFDGLGDRIAAEASPPVPDLDPVAPQLWWTWVCPIDDFTGRLHVAGQARERHALYVVCDTCGRSFLR